jgi:hypothetical protein
MLVTSMINNKIRFYFRNMKLDSTLKINVSALKQALIDAGSDYSVNDIKADLQSIGATVEGAKEDGLVYMYISGNVDVEDIETAFDEANVDVNEFVVNGDLSECDGMDDTNECDDTFECDGDGLDECGIPEFDEVGECDDTFECNEKKQDCCPKKKVVNEADKISEIRKIRKNDQKQSNVLIPLKEALRGDVRKTNKEDIPSLNGLIDHICGKRNSKTVNEAAINKAKAERGEALNEGLEFLKEKLGEKLYNQICEAMRNNKKSLHENISINKKKLVDYTLDELQSIFEKITSQVEELKNKNTDGLNEEDSAMIQQKLTTKERLAQILSEEIAYRQAITEDDDFAGLDSMNLDPNKEDGDDADAEKEEKKDDEKSEENDNPDEDEEEEIGSIVITLASKEAAEELKSDLIDAEIPEDVIEIAPVESEDEESEDEESEESEENAEETSEESSDKASEEKTEESVSSKGTKLNEEDETSDEEESTDEENNEEDAEETSEEEEEGAYKLILTDTDYAKNLRDTLELKWGLTKDEFADMIGGEIVDDDNEEENSDENSEETSDEESSDSEKSEEDEDKEIEDEFNPDEIFKGI